MSDVEASCGRRIDHDGLMASLDRVLCICLDDTISVLESCLDYMVNVLEDQVSHLYRNRGNKATESERYLVII
jgi:hypothetical protein